MQIIRISDIHHPRFGEVWHLYQNSFPVCEQRTLDHQITAFKADRFHLDVYLDGETLVGFIGYWDFDDYLYIEHYAINSDLRGGGWGSRILEALQKTAGKTIILEIDEVVDEISTRRLRFYQRLGFVVNPYIHPLHRYRDIETEHQNARLVIMTYPGTIDPQTYERFNRDLGEIVMKRDEQLQTNTK